MIKRIQKGCSLLLILALLCSLFGVTTPVQAAEITPGSTTFSAAFPDVDFCSYVTNTVLAGSTDPKGNDDPVTAEQLTAIQQWTDVQIAGGDIRDLSGIENFTGLKTLNCRNLGALSALDVSKNVGLKTLDCSFTQITELNLTQNIALEELACENTSLKELNLSSNKELKTLNCQNNVALTTLTCANPKLETLDLAGDAALSFLSCEDHTAMTSLILTDCVALETLKLYDTDGEAHSDGLTVLDLTPCTALKTLDIHNRYGLTGLDLSENVALSEVTCYHNPDMVTLSVSKNLALETLDCHDNEALETLTLPEVEGGNPVALRTLRCYNNPELNDLDIESYSNLEVLKISGNGGLSSLELSGSDKLKSLDVSGGNLESLTVTENAALETLNCSSNKLTSLIVSDNPTLATINCANNQLGNLAISNNPALKTLDCSSSELTSLTVSNNPALETLNCSNNELSFLDVSDKPLLVSLNCANNQMGGLYLFANTALETLDCHGNENLGSLTLPSSSDPTDPSKTPSLKTLLCYDTTLQALDVTGVPKLETLDCHAGSLGTLDLSKSTVLTTLNCSNNQLAELNISKNTALEVLLSASNPLTELDVSANTKLETLDCSQNQLKKLDVSKNTALKVLSCASNDEGLETLILPEVIAPAPANLQELNCENNQLETLDISNSTDLVTLRCDNNQLTSLDASNHGSLETLTCSFNQLDQLDVSGDNAMKTLSCAFNHLVALSAPPSARVDGIGQTVSSIAKAEPSGSGAWVVKLGDILGSSGDFKKVTMTDGSTYDPNTGLATYTTKPSQVTYTYDISPTSLFTVAATLAENTYTVTYDLNGGTAGTGPEKKSGVSSETSFQLDSTVTPTRTPDGNYTYSFAGWALSPTAPVTPVTSVYVTGDVTVYAIWTASLISSGGGGGGGGGGANLPIQYTLSFETNGGSQLSSVSMTDGSIANLGGYTTTREGYTFSGWYSNSTLANKITSVTISKNTTVYAGWTKNSPLIQDDHFAYISGFADGTFLPDNTLTRGQAAMIFYRLLVDKNATTELSFTDIPADGWCAEAVRVLNGQGVLTGFSDGTFRPDRPITRAQFTAVLSRFYDLSGAGTATFSDISSHYWAYYYITSAADRGWISGFADGTFRPDQSITRAQAVKLLNAVLKRSADQNFVNGNGGVTFFTDVPSHYWAYYDISEAANSHNYTVTDGVEKWSSLRAK